MRSILSNLLASERLAWRHWAPPLLLTGLSCFGGVSHAGEIRAASGAASLGSRVNGGAACLRGHCAISGGTRSGKNLFHRFSHFDTRGSITGVSLKNGSASAVVLGVTNPMGMFLDKTLSLQNPARLFVLSPGGVHLGGGAGFINAPQIQLSTATGLKVGESWFDVANTTAPVAAGLSGELSASSLGLKTDAGSLSQLNRDGNGDIVLQGGLLTIDQDLFLDSQGGDVALDQVAVHSDGGIFRAKGQAIRLMDAQIDMSSSSANGGLVLLESVEATSVSGASAIWANGATGGTIDLLGGSVVVDGSSQIRADGTIQAGEIRIGGDIRGANPGIRTASTTFLGDDVVISANGLDQGNGGRIIIWSDDNTAMLARLEAQGGANGGDGGFIETSSAGVISFGDVVPSVGAPKGTGGFWLIDPKELIVCEASACKSSDQKVSVNPDGSLSYSPADDQETSYISSTAVEGALESNGSVILEAETRVWVQEAANITPSLDSSESALLVLRTTSGQPVDGVSGPITPEIRVDGEISPFDKSGTLNVLIESAGNVVLNGGITTALSSDLSSSVDILASGQVEINNSIYAGSIKVSGSSIDVGANASDALIRSLDLMSTPGVPASLVQLTATTGDLLFKSPVMDVYAENGVFEAGKDIKNLAKGGKIRGVSSLAFRSNQFSAPTRDGSEPGPGPGVDRIIDLSNMYLETPSVSFEGGGAVVAAFNTPQLQEAVAKEVGSDLATTFGGSVTNIEGSIDTTNEGNDLTITKLDASDSYVEISNNGRIFLGGSGTDDDPNIKIGRGGFIVSTSVFNQGFTSDPSAAVDNVVKVLGSAKVLVGGFDGSALENGYLSDDGLYELTLGANQISNFGSINVRDSILNLKLQPYGGTVSGTKTSFYSQPVFRAEPGSRINLEKVASSGGGQLWLDFDSSSNVFLGNSYPLYQFDDSSILSGVGVVRKLPGQEALTRFASGSVIAPGTESQVGGIEFTGFGSGELAQNSNGAANLVQGLLFEPGAIIEIDVSDSPLAVNEVDTANPNGVKFASDFVEFASKTTPWFYEGNESIGPQGPTLRVQLLDEFPSVPSEKTFLSALRGQIVNSSYFVADLSSGGYGLSPRVNLP